MGLNEKKNHHTLPVNVCCVTEEKSYLCLTIVCVGAVMLVAACLLVSFSGMSCAPFFLFVYHY